jgi:hypothetical protein
MKPRTTRSERAHLWLVAAVAAATSAHCATSEPELSFGANAGALCERACGRIYDTCHLSLGTASGALSRSQCVDQCRAGSIDGFEMCLSEVACSRDAVVGCFQSVPIRPGTSPMGADASAPLNASTPVMDAGASNPPPPPPPPAYTCATACNQIYNVCNARISQNGTTLTQSGCEQLCATDARYSNNVACLSTMQCSAGAFGACLSGSGNPPPPPPPPVDSGVTPPRDSGVAPPPPAGSCPALSAPFGRSVGQSVPDFNGVRCSDGGSINYRNTVWCGARLTIVATGSFT